MSTAPRPHRYPSRTSPENGGTDQSAASAGTTSRCPCTSSAGSEGSVPGTRAITLDRPGAASRIFEGMPIPSRNAATYSAASRSPSDEPPPWLVLSKRSRSAQMSTTSAINALHRPRRDGCDHLERLHRLGHVRRVEPDPADPDLLDRRNHRRGLREVARV